MTDKKEFIQQLVEQLEKIEQDKFEVQDMYINIRAKEYSWGGGDVGISYRIDERLNLDKKKDFECEMRYGECERRGYCNGDC